MMSNMDLKVRFVCVCSKNIPALCRVCNGKGYRDHRMSFEELSRYPRPWWILGPRYPA
jgi:hypothetical protein